MTTTLHTFSVRVAAVLLASSSLVLAQWNQKSPATSPSARVGAAMDWNPTLGKLLLFGGAAPGLSSETWTYDGSNWALLSPATSPSGRSGAQLVHDAARGVTVLYGGLASPISIPPPTSETWEFDGLTWTQATPAANAGPRYLYGACYDGGRSRVVMYGGASTQLVSVPNSQTWEYDGLTWTQIATTGNPGPRNRPAMCYHQGLGATVLFGGHNGSANTDQTWIYDGATSTWIQVPVVGSKPSPRNAATLVYDPVRNLCVLTGGQDSGVLADTWTFDGSSWTQQPVTTQGVRDHTSAFLPTIGHTVKFGGFVSAPFTLSNETWEFGSGVLGTGCAGPNGVPSLTASTAPLLGQPYSLDLTNLNPSINVAALVFGFTQLPGVDLVIIDMPGCLARTTADILVTLVGAGGAANYTWNPVFGAVGDAFYAQALCLDPGVNGFGFTISNAVFATIGN
jgi:hypothetical protein